MIVFARTQSQKLRDTTFLKVTKCFSIVDNFRQLVETQFYFFDNEDKSDVDFNAIYTDNKEQKEKLQTNFEFLNGLRCILFFWICFGATYLFRFQAIQNWTDQIYQSNSGGWFTIAAAANFAPDTFFWISGFIATVSLLQQINEIRPMNWVFFFKIYFHRIIRLWPSYILCLAIYWLWLPSLANGPIWNQQIAASNQCNTNWWQNFLLIDNLFTHQNGQLQPNGQITSDYCFQWGWFISNEWQFYLITPFILWLYSRNHLKGIVLISLLLAGSFLAGMLISYQYNYHFDFPSQENNIPQPTYFDYFYIKPYVRISTYLIGMLVGLLYRGFDDQENWALKIVEKIKNYPYIRLLSIIIGLMLINYMIWCVIPLQMDGQAWGQAEQSLYLTFGRVIFVIGISLIFIPAMFKGTQLLNHIFGANCWKPVARLSYCASLIFFVVISRSYYAEQQFIVFSNWLFIYYCIADIVVSIVLGCWIYLISEAPMFNLESLIIWTIDEKIKQN